MTSSMPNFFIVGAPKCGTSALAQWLASHPYIYMSLVKEPHYYSTDLNLQRVRTPHEYHGLYKGVTPKHKAVGEASASYLYSKEAIPNILKEIPDAKFVVCFRNPVEMAYSFYGQLLKAADEHIDDFSTAWHAQPQRQRGENVSKFCSDSQLLLYGPVCSLGEQFERLLSSVPRRRICTVVHDDLKVDAGQCYRNVLEFLGVPDDGRASFPVVNAASVRRYKYLHLAMKMVEHTRQMLRIPRLGTGIGASLAGWNSRRQAPPTMDGEVREELRRYFVNDIRRLERQLGRDLSNWLEGGGEAVANASVK